MLVHLRVKQALDSECDAYASAFSTASSSDH
jgi:hypothetical protein